MATDTETRSQTIQEAAREIKQDHKQIAKEGARDAEYIAEMEQRLKDKDRLLWNLMIMAGAGLLAIGVVMAGFLTPKLGGAVALGGLTLLGTGIVLMNISPYIPWIVGTISVFITLGIGYVVYSRIQHDRQTWDGAGDILKKSIDPDSSVTPDAAIAALRGKFPMIDRYFKQKDTP